MVSYIYNITIIIFEWKSIDGREKKFLISRLLIEKIIIALLSLRRDFGSLI